MNEIVYMSYLTRLTLIWNAIVVAKCDTSSAGELAYVTVIYRHGDRTPVEPYPKDPYGNLSYWPVGWGQLTNIGKEQHFELGKWFRQRYDGFLPYEYSNEDIYIRSSDVDRTLMSAASNLAGLYPPKGKQRWNNNLVWQPIPIHTVPEHLDEIIAGHAPCPQYEELLKQLMESEDMVRYKKEHEELYKYITESTGSKVDTPETLEYVYNTLYIEELYNLTLPEWTKKVYPKQMIPVADFSFAIPAFNKRLQRLKIGPMLKQILLHMKLKTKGNLVPDYKMAVYSGHDTTVANVLNALGVFEPHCPPYRSVIIIELKKQTSGEYFVSVYYRNSTTVEPYLMTIPGCESLCPLNKFEEIIKPVIPVNWKRECQTGFLSYWTNEEFGYNSFAIAGQDLKDRIRHEEIQCQERNHGSSAFHVKHYRCAILAMCWPSIKLPKLTHKPLK